MSSSQSNKLGQIYVEWDIKTQILRYVSACSVARNSNCPMYTLCTVGIWPQVKMSFTDGKISQFKTLCVEKQLKLVKLFELLEKIMLPLDGVTNLRQETKP